MFLSIHAVNVYVRDQDASLRFFIDQLGFYIAFDARLQTGERWVAVSPPDGTAVLSLVAPAPDSKEARLIGLPTGIVFAAEDVPAKYAEWRKRGVRFMFAPRLRRLRYGHGTQHTSEDTPVWGGVFTRFYDLDGNSFALVGIEEVNLEIQLQRMIAAEKQEAERRAAQELEIATQVQARLFPQSKPAIETLEYAGVCIQARQVGGDYYDFLDLGRGRYGLVVSDISGKGIAAALLMANLQANLRSQSAIALDAPERLLQSVNRVFYENTTESSYATLFFVLYDSASRSLRYANCGHLPGLLLRRGGAVEKLESTCTVLGLFRDLECSFEHCELSPGDVLALYTDGVTESFNESGEDFGERRLIDELRRSCELSAQCAINAILQAVRQFSPREQHDDITAIVARCI